MHANGYPGDRVLTVVRGGSGLNELLERRTLHEFEPDTEPGRLVLEVCQRFGSNSVERIAAQRHAIAAADGLLVSSSAVGARALAQLCATVRALARNASFDEARSHVILLESEHRRVRAAIEAQHRSGSRVNRSD